MKYLLIILFSSSLWANNCLIELSTFEAPKRGYVEYAQNFQLYQFLKYDLMVIKGESVLFAKDMSIIKNLCPGTPKYQIPFNRIVVTSTTHIPPFEMLGAAESLVGASNTKLISSKGVVKRIRKGKIADTGYPLNSELIAAMNPDIIITYVAESKELEGVASLERIGLPTISNYDFLEKHPLSRAEWIKFFGVLIDKKEEAQKLFAKISSRYESLRRKAQTITAPLVIAGKNNSETWHAPNSKSDFIRILNDAGGKYLWQNDSSYGEITKNIEEVFSQINKVSYWFPQNSWNSLRDILREDSRHKKFALIKSSYIFNNNNKVNKAGGNDYWETAVMRPDLLLKDLIFIMHPQLIPGHRLIWYKQLK